MSKRAAAPCAEFPNDNESLHMGSIWSVEGPCDFPSPLIRQIVWESVSVIDVDTAIRMLDEEPIASEEEAWRDLEEVDEKTERMVMAVTMTPIDESADIVIEEFEDTVFASTESFSAEDKKEIVFESDPVLNARTETLAPPAPEVQPIAPPIATSTSTATATETSTPIATPSPSPLESSTQLSDPFALYVRIVAEIALSLGDATAATRLPTWLEDGDGEGMADAIKSMMGPLPTWRGLIRGEEVDFSGCGASMLDEWTADLIAIAIGDSSRATHIKQILRSRGIAAFGLLEAA